MHITIENYNVILLIASLLIFYVLFQIYLILKIKVVVERILEIFLKINNIVNEYRKTKSENKSKVIRTCQYCKNRIIYFHSENESYFYIKCRLNNQAVNPEDFCHYFVFDSQNYEI